MPDRVTLELRLRLPAVWLLALLVAALLLPDRIWITFLVGLGGLFLIAYAWARSLRRGLTGQRRLRYGWVSVGDRLVEEFTLRYHGWLPALWVEVQDEANVPGYSAALVRSAAGVTRWKKEAICRQRGQFHLGPWRLVSGDPFGIFRVTHHYPTSEDIIIHPPVHAGLPIPLPVGQSAGRAQARQRAWQPTINSGGVRDYAPRDPLRWIHWPTSARTGALHVHEFDLDAAGDLWILVDMQAAAHLGQGRDGTEEQAIIVAATLADRALEAQRAVGVACYGQRPQVVPPGRGQRQRWRLLRALALARADGAAPLQTALDDLGRQVRRGSSAVIITPAGDADWFAAGAQLGQRGIRSTVVLMDRPSFGGPGNTAALRQAIRERFAACEVVERDAIGRPAFAAERHGFWEFKITPSGRAIPVRRPEE